MNPPTGAPKESRTLRFEDLERTGRGARTRYLARLADATGAERYELVIAGQRAAIDPLSARPNSTWRSTRRPTSAGESRLRPAWEQEQGAASSPRWRTYQGSFAKGRRPGTAERSLFVSVRPPLEPDGTRYLFTARNFAVPQFFSAFFALPPPVLDVRNPHSRRLETRISSCISGGRRSSVQYVSHGHPERVLHALHALRPDLPGVRLHGWRLLVLRLRGNRHLSGK